MGVVALPGSAPESTPKFDLPKVGEQTVGVGVQSLTSPAAGFFPRFLLEECGDQPSAGRLGSGAFPVDLPVASIVSKRWDDCTLPRGMSSLIVTTGSAAAGNTPAAGCSLLAGSSLTVPGLPVRCLGRILFRLEAASLSVDSSTRVPVPRVPMSAATVLDLR